jgi:hypothetical protein
MWKGVKINEFHYLFISNSFSSDTIHITLYLLHLSRKKSCPFPSSATKLCLLKILDVLNSPVWDMTNPAEEAPFNLAEDLVLLSLAEEVLVEQAHLPEEILLNPVGEVLASQGPQSHRA